MFKKSFIFLSLFVFSFVLFTGSTNAKTFPPDQPVVVKELLGNIEYVKGKILQLEEAIPEEKFSWRPGEDVRSVSEVYMHIAGANFMLVNVINDKKWDGDPKEFEKSATTKKEVAEMLNNSFAAVVETVGGLTEEDLNKTVKVFGMEFTVRNFVVNMLGHMQEHLGQSIAYARMNDVTPPWSENEEEDY